jgi:single-strand DNA-binding protein
MSVRSLNKVMLIGNLTKDPTMRFTPTGSAVCSFSVATNSSWTPRDGGEKQEKVEYHNIVAWNKLAELCGQLLKKGDKVYLEGRLQTRDWKSNEGQDRRTTEVVISDMLLLTSKGGSGYQAQNNSNNSDDNSMANEDVSAPNDTAANDDVSDVQDISEDIPF